MEMGYAGELQSGALIATGVVLLAFILIINLLFGLVTGRKRDKSGKKISGGALGAAAFAEENVHLVFWHGMSGTNGEIIDYIVRTFNESHPGIEIEAQYQGSYEESINKLKAAMRTGDGPDMIQIYEAGTRFMVDSGFVNPVQNLIDKYSIDVSHLEKHILDYYTVNDQLYSMPLNTSIPVLYYNADMLRAIGF